VIPIPEGSGFGLDNLPLGTSVDGRVWVAVGDHAVDVGLTGPLNRHLADWPARRTRLQEQLSTDRFDDVAVPRSSLTMALPVAVGDYVDGYASIHHATNLGRRFRPDGDPLLPNWRHLPVAYHGRSSSIVVSGTDVVRPHGLRQVAGDLAFGPTEQLDIELEVGLVVGVGNDLGRPIAIDDVDDHIAGFCLVNDWSARDIQAFEYQPLGPFLGKSFATSMSPWLVANDALQPFRVPPPAQDPQPAPYLRAAQPWGLDLHLEVWRNGERITRTGFADMYWTPAQQLAHVTVNGAATRPGDLIASGTVSGPDPGTEGSLIEQGGPFLADGDVVTMKGWAGDRDGGGPWIDLGEVTGQVASATGIDS
jgi:fumarylacetoacetase